MGLEANHNRLFSSGSYVAGSFSNFIPDSQLNMATSSHSVAMPLAEPTPLHHHLSSQDIQRNVTSVQVHHTPPWVGGPPQGNIKQEPIYANERKNGLLPAYQSPPDYETFLREKYSIHGIVPNGANYNSVGTIGMNTPNYANLPSGMPGHMVPMSAPYSVHHPHDYSNMDHLRPGPKMTVQRSHYSVPRINEAITVSHTINYSTPNLHTANMCTVPIFSQGPACPPANTYFNRNSIPDLPMQNGHSAAPLQLIDGPYHESRLI